MAPPLRPYTDVVQLVRDIRSHTLKPGHEVVSLDAPETRIFWYSCVGCAAEGLDFAWFIGMKDIKKLRDQKCSEAQLLVKLLSSQKGRGILVEYLNHRIDFELAPILDRYHRPLVI